jgi:mono/diheme cytochrome c family protein
MNANRQMLTAFAFLICLTGCAAGPQKTSAPLTAEHFSNDVMAGRKLFAQHCAACHGANAKGTSRAPSLNTDSVQGMSDDALVRFLTNGDLRKGMPSWSRLPEERRWQLTHYIKSLSKTER